MEKYFMWIHYERLHNHNKPKHNKTVCLFLGIYCNNTDWYFLTSLLPFPMLHMRFTKSLKAKETWKKQFALLSDQYFYWWPSAVMCWDIYRHIDSQVWVYTVYPKKYAHGFVVLCFVVVMQSFIMNSHEVFIHIHQDCFAGTGAIVRLPQCQWSKPDGYGKISQCITTTKHSKAKTVCIFLGLYCTWDRLTIQVLIPEFAHHWVCSCPRI